MAHSFESGFVQLATKQCHKGSVHIQRSQEERIQGKLKIKTHYLNGQNSKSGQKTTQQQIYRSENLKNVKIPNKKESNFVA